MLLMNLKVQNVLLLFLVFSLAKSTKVLAQLQYPFQDSNMPVEKRIDNILSLMTLSEKVKCLSTNPTVERLGIKGTGHSEGLHGLALGVPGDWGHKTPVPTTTFPQSIGMAETWDPNLIHTAAALEGYDARYIAQSEKYKHQAGLVIRAPNADLGRDPRWGRTEECYGEDPYFNGTMVVSYIKGLQGDNPKYWQAAALMKHFLANSNERGRDSSSSNFDERLFREYYSVPFRMGIQQGGSRAYMASYNAVNGIPQTVSPMLKNITVNEWGQNGIICTDGGAYTMLVTAHKYFKTPEEAAAACIKAGINQFLDKYEAGVNTALEKKMLVEADLDKVLRGVFRVMIKLGQLDPAEMVPYSQIKDGLEPWLSQKNRDFVKQITQKSVVLLKNSKALLPLDQSKVRTIAIVGPRSGKVYEDWYSGSPAYSISPLEGLKQKVGGKINVLHTENDNLAVSLAREADVAIVCIGNHPTGNAGWAKVSSTSEGKEAVDRQEINLDTAQEALIKKVFLANPNTIVVLISSFPYAINWAQENIPAILHVTHNSPELGTALADVLFGDVNPGGRLVQTWPKSLDQLPPMMDYNIRDGRTYMYEKAAPLYPFGYGLSYTTFKYSNLQLSEAKMNSKGQIMVHVDITNTGMRAGDEVVQLYVKHVGSKVQRAQKELKGFKRITLAPNETQTVSIPLIAEQLAYWNTRSKKFVVERDQVQVLVGSSSADIRAQGSVAVN
jgi:beta-glucosidase